MAPILLLIQNPNSGNQDLIQHFEQLKYKLRVVDSVASAIQLIDDNGVKPSAILVDIPELCDQQMSQIESIEESLGIHEWVIMDYDLEASLAERLEDVSYRTIKQPCTNKRIEMVIKKAVRSTQVRRRLAHYSDSDTEQSSLNSIVGQSRVISEHRQMLKDLAQVPISSMIIKGETGTGKGHAAKILHSNGLRKDSAFIEMNCAAMPSELVESQLFGHENGAFTGAKGRHRGLLEQADNGTLFLDEIGEMPLDVQAKLLKAIEEQSFRRVGGEHEISVDVQVIAASNRDLEEMVVAGEFREDLYHRLNVFEITVPALREYKSDLPELVPAIISEFNRQAGKQVQEVSDKAWAEMLDYDWPGNVRELRNALERAVLLSTNQTLNEKWLKLNNALLEEQLDGVANDASRDGSQSHADDQFGDNVTSLSVVKSDELTFKLDGQTSLEEMDRQIIAKALQLSQNNISQAAELLGATRETLRYRIQKYELNVG